MKRFSLVICLLSFFLTTYAQHEDEEPYLKPPKIAVKFIFLPLLDYTPTVQFALEAKTFQQQAIQIEYGYIWNLYKKRFPNIKFNGFKLKTEYRYYLKNSYKNHFFGVQHMYKKLTTKGQTSVWRNNKAYQEVLAFRLINSTNSFYLVKGRVYSLTKSLRIESAFGVGVRLVDISLKDVPDDAELTTNVRSNIFNPINSEGKYAFLGLFYSIKIVLPVR